MFFKHALAVSCRFRFLSGVFDNYEKHALRVSQVIAAVAKVSCKHGLWLVVHIKKIRPKLGTDKTIPQPPCFLLETSTNTTHQHTRFL